MNLKMILNFVHCWENHNIKNVKKKKYHLNTRCVRVEVRCSNDLLLYRYCYRYSTSDGRR